MVIFPYNFKLTLNNPDPIDDFLGIFFHTKIIDNYT
jgi:hypothetical protein